MSRHPSDLDLYSHMSSHAAATVIADYSTSFSAASKLLSPRVREDIRNLYSVVRIADEIVDGVAKQAGLDDAQIREELNRFAADVQRGIELGFSANPAIHAFAGTAQRNRIASEHISAFFDSMRRDLERECHDESSLNEYIYGSAEVIGLMCLAIFISDSPLSPKEHERAQAGAQRLGAAFQKINFLRDLGEDCAVLGRKYFPGTDEGLDELKKQQLIDDIYQDLEAAYAAIPLLPLSARTGVYAAYLIFQDLTKRLETTPASAIMQTRVSVPKATKAKLIAKAIAGGSRL